LHTLCVVCFLAPLIEHLFSGTFIDSLSHTMMQKKSQLLVMSLCSLAKAMPVTDQEESLCQRPACGDVTGLFQKAVSVKRHANMEVRTGKCGSFKCNPDLCGQYDGQTKVGRSDEGQWGISHSVPPEHYSSWNRQKVGNLGMSAGMRTAGVKIWKTEGKVEVIDGAETCHESYVLEPKAMLTPLAHDYPRMPGRFYPEDHQGDGALQPEQLSCTRNRLRHNPVSGGPLTEQGVCDSCRCRTVPLSHP